MSADEESDGFKFATMLLATLGTIIYAAYTYFQSRAVEPNIYAIFVGLITALLALSILLIMYIFVKGYYMEEQDLTRKQKLKNSASYIFSIAFEVGGMVVLVIFGGFLFVLYAIKVYYLLYLALIFFGYYLGFFEKLLSFLENKSYINLFEKFKSFLRDSINFDQSKLKRAVVIFITISILVLWGLQYNVMLDLFQGDAKIDMNNIYYKNGEPIPVSIEILGRDPGLSIYLYNATSEIYNITLKQRDELNKIEDGEYLIGDAFALGKYYVFINTTNMSEGYYRLAYSHAIDGRSIDRYKYGKSFYLLNQSNNS